MLTIAVAKAFYVLHENRHMYTNTVGLQVQILVDRSKVNGCGGSAKCSDVGFSELE